MGEVASRDDGRLWNIVWGYPSGRSCAPEAAFPYGFILYQQGSDQDYAHDKVDRRGY